MTDTRAAAFAEVIDALRAAGEAQLPEPITYEDAAVFIEKYAALDIAPRTPSAAPPAGTGDRTAPTPNAPLRPVLPRADGHPDACPSDGRNYFGRCLGECVECGEHILCTGRYTPYCPSCDRDAD